MGSCHKCLQWCAWWNNKSKTHDVSVDEWSACRNHKGSMWPTTTFLPLTRSAVHCGGRFAWTWRKARYPSVAYEDRCTHSHASFLTAQSAVTVHSWPTDGPRRQLLLNAYRLSPSPGKMDSHTLILSSLKIYLLVTSNSNWLALT